MLNRWIFAVALVVFSCAASAQFPGKPIRLVVPFPAGSATDTISRILNCVTARSRPPGLGAPTRWLSGEEC